MNNDQLQLFKQRLEDDKIRLNQELEVLGSKDPNRPDAAYPESGGNSDEDNAAEITEYVDELSIEARIEAELRDVQKALTSIEKGTYGICKYCNKDIDLKRLEARPASSSCIDCKKLLTQEM
ncbi:TraR/DksA C4-type zinc finger protein [Patescibacteria group bacterium]|nr:TraR/DksA C4-type zinc finger protein [Patescibacteria group bacterium]MBU1034667.1 TraR/DksA C4-type zinc finger protein [Patescibacteria group bacterium]MBU1629556.1 TraR/DksA C4-type zinc finger protein [Patescibacteria group bacterium]MBU1907813.1 TraR/DksA C4-type zinc finger protein [Patescibacteria group bacterium]